MINNNTERFRFSTLEIKGKSTTPNARSRKAPHEKRDIEMRQSNKKDIEAVIDQKYGTVDADKLSSK